MQRKVRTMFALLRKLLAWSILIRSCLRPIIFTDQKGRTATYSYDVAGSRQSRTSTVAGLGAQSFGYDANDRIQGDASDPNGNTRAGTAARKREALWQQ